MKWISVNDRLPSKETPVLVTYIGYNDGRPYSDHIACICDGKWRWWDCEPGAEARVEITHWAPLPDPAEYPKPKSTMQALEAENEKLRTELYVAKEDIRYVLVNEGIDPCILCKFDPKTSPCAKDYCGEWCKKNAAWRGIKEAK